MYILEKPSTLQRCQTRQGNGSIFRTHTVFDSTDRCDLMPRIATRGSLGNRYTVPGTCCSIVCVRMPMTKRLTHRQGQQMTCLGLAVQITQFILLSSQPSSSDSSVGLDLCRRLDICGLTGVSCCPTLSMIRWYRRLVKGNEEELTMCASRTGTEPDGDSSLVRLRYSSAGWSSSSLSDDERLLGGV